MLTKSSKGQGTVSDAREIGKDPDAFRTISEVADELALPQHVLRFWETRFHQIKPVKRAGGRRFYRPEDVDLLRGIRRLLYQDGFTIKGAQKILKDQGIRHVQDLGIEGDVAAIRSAAGDDASEGKSFGGLLGLLPLRRNKDKEEPQRQPPALDEPPLPFPDLNLEEDFDAADEAPDTEPPSRMRGTTQRVEERRYAQGVFEERIVEERHFEGGFSSPAEPAISQSRLSHHEDPPFFADDEPDDMDEADLPSQDRVDPSFAPEPTRETRRPEPVLQQRPSRGPAAHIATAPRPEYQDTLLPFMDGSQAGDEASESLEARIRRLKEQEQQAAASHIADHSGPPSEYVPQRHRAGSEGGARLSSPRLDEMEPDDLPSVVRGSAREDQDAYRVSAGTGAGDVRHSDSHPPSAPDTEGREQTERAHIPAPMPPEREGRYQEAAEPSYPPARHEHSARTASRAEPPPAPPRFGPFTEPVVEEFDLPPVDMRRTPNGRAVWEERANWEEEWPEPRSRAMHNIPEPRMERMPPPSPAPRMRYGIDPRDAEPAGSYAPHPARSDMRMPGQGVMPVLSRDDIHRLQAALYELSECQRLMESVLDDEKP